jgi:hypothetical protein
VVDGTVRVQWHTWDGAGTVSHEPITPAGTYAREYLAFFDQIDRSISFWSPDGRAFVFAGAPGDREGGIWVQRIDGSAPVRVAEGTLAVWSPID